MSEIKDNYRYTKKHEWVKLSDDNTALIGITDHAQAELSDIIFIELPSIGTKVVKDDEVLVVESIKAASDIYAPLNGEIIEVNENLTNDPSLVNNSPYEDGWLFKIKIDEIAEVENLLSADQYKEEIT